MPFSSYRDRAGHEECSGFVCCTQQKSAAYGQQFCPRNSIRVTPVRESARDNLCAVNRFAITDMEANRSSGKKEEER